MTKRLLLAFLLTITLSCGQDTPLAEYEPKSSLEEALKNVLMDFQSGANTKDAGKIADLIHADASIMVDRDRKILTRTEYVNILPERLAENPPVFLGTPRIKISDDAAEVKTYMSRGNSRVLITFQMQYDSSRWYIKGWKF